MAKGVYISGIEKMNKKLKMISEMEKQKTFKALITAGILIRRDMEKTSPKTPVDTSNLRHSWFMTTVKGTASNPSFKGADSSKLAGEHSAAVGDASTKTALSRIPLLVMGFSAHYATFVHEFPKKRKPVKFKRPGAGYKFFEESLNRNKQNIMAILKIETQLP